MALVCLPLLKEPERWVHRRIEQVYFKDYSTTRHQVSVDFTLPPTVPPVSTFEGREVFPAPLFLLRKSPDLPSYKGKLPRKQFLLLGDRHRPIDKTPIPTSSISDIDFTDQDGQCQPLLTRSQSRLLATIILLEAAQEIIGDPVGDQLRGALWAIANWEWDSPRHVLRYLFASRVTWPDPRRKLQDDPDFPELAYALASHSLIVCLFVGRPPRRAIYKLSYDEPVTPAGGIRRLGRSIGWFSEKVFVPLNEIGGSSSYHVEVAVPAELEVNATGLYGYRYRLFDREPDTLTADELDYDILQVRQTAHGDVYIPKPLKGRRVGEAWVKLRAARSGFIRGALVAALITSGVLWATFARLDELVRVDRSDASVALLLVMPAVLAAYVARPGDHAITNKMLLWARILLVIDAALPFAAALLLMTTSSAPVSEIQVPLIGKAAVPVVRVSPIEFQRARKVAQHTYALQARKEKAAIKRLRKRWKRLAIASLALVAQFLGAWYFPRPHGRTRYRIGVKGRSGDGRSSRRNLRSGTSRHR